MNIIDWLVGGTIALCVLFGLYRGFIQSALNLGGCLLSFIGSFVLFPRIADVISANTDITRTISSYTDSTSLLGSLDLSSQAVSSLSEQTISAIIQQANLPKPMDTILMHNLQGQVFQPMGNLAVNVGDYVNQTILSVSINVLSFVVCFLVCFITLTILINMLRAVFRYPVLKQLDGLAGGAFGFLLGIALCFVAFTVMPILESVIPLPVFRELMDGSSLAQFFQNGNLVISIMNRKL